jgi:hypothetical protein
VDGLRARELGRCGAEALGVQNGAAPSSLLRSESPRREQRASDPAGGHAVLTDGVVGGQATVRPAAICMTHCYIRYNGTQAIIQSSTTANSPGTRAHLIHIRAGPPPPHFPLHLTLAYCVMKVPPPYRSVYVAPSSPALVQLSLASPPHPRRKPRAPSPSPNLAASSPATTRGGAV